MVLCVDLESLPRCRNGITVLIQVVKIYYNHFERYPGEKIVVVVDEKGFRMPLTIRSSELKQFHNKLRHGLWYYIHNLEVSYKPMKQRFTTSDLHLYVNPETVVLPFSGEKTSMLYDFKPIPKIEDISKVISVVDVIGVVSELYRTQHEDAIVRSSGIIPAERSIFFVFKDFTGNTINCFVKNNFHDRFLEAWLTTKPHYPTICVLHLWDIELWEGVVALFANSKYSSFEFETPIIEVQAAKNSLHFSDQFVHFYDDYALHPNRPKNLPF